MTLISFTNIIAPLLVLSCFCVLAFSGAIDTITPNQFIRDPESITSNGSIFKLGFFSPNGSTNRYVGIWFNDVSILNVIWVANRDKPLNDTSGAVTISEEGNLLVLNGQNQIVWSSNFSSSSTNATAQILDSGNLVLRNDNGGGILWESFKNISDSFLEYMKLSSNTITGEMTVLRSWKSPSDPSIGRFSAGLDPLDIPEFFIWNDSRPYWRSGPWNGQLFIGIPSMNSVYLNGLRIESDGDGTRYITIALANKSDHISYVLNSQGTLKEMYLKDGIENGKASWLSKESECDVYGNCGAYGSCNMKNKPICSCLRGFEPKNVEEWSRGNWTSGCVRTTQLQCERINSGGESQGKEDGFLKLQMVKVPDFMQWSSALGEKCKNQCFENCSCLAYALHSGIGCMLWAKNLIDIQEFSYGGTDLYIRVAYSELDKKQDIKVIIAITVILGTITIAICTYFTWRWMANQRDKKTSKEVLLFNRGDAYQNFPDNNMFGENMNQDEKIQELPVFSFATLATATNNFDIANKLGQGGFGPVYRGKLLIGQEIAVKRLSRASGQGLEEFMNEVVVISKLQHRNLVRILGCCIEQEEKMLVYEYMANKSLDAFLFDPLKRELLHWRKRFEIIEGIGRGLLYLHRDSRLRIIHRDLKASNILLDEELNPKISDFGMARIFVSDQDQAKTTRVVGTYGYMSPEYAMEGRFSEKSDVFSFGVLLLEIVSGRRNTSFYNDEQSLSLLGFVWKLWNEDNIHELVDSVISSPNIQKETIRCIHVGLLCVQEFAKDRPTVSTVLSMLTSEIIVLPTPKQPAFTERQIGSYTKFAPNNQKRCSINNVTITIIEGR